jgi:dienelactone hydrolase
MRPRPLALLLLLFSVPGVGCGSAPPVRPSSAGAPATCTAVTAPFVGTICAPAGAGRHPAILVLGGWPGGDSMRDRARQLAASGYVAASVAYFATPGTQPALVAVPVEIIGRALNVLRARADVDPDRVAIIGSSKGGELALLAAATYPEIHAVIADAPAPFAWFGLGDNGTPTGCSWAHEGEPVACVRQDPDAGRELGAQFAGRGSIVLRPMYDHSFSRADPAVVRAALFPLERVAGPILCLAGEDDQVWDGPGMCTLTMKILRDHHHPFADRMVSYPGAGHAFLAAHDGPASALNTWPLGSRELLLGGKPDADARAAAAAWSEIDAFLAAAWRR